MQRVHFAIAAAMLSCAVGAGWADPPTDEDTSSESASDAAQGLVSRLGHADYDARVRATQHLLQMGPMATTALSVAAESDELETALRARRLLDIFREMYFAGVEVALASSRTEIAWDESFDVVVRMKNTTAFAARVPMDTHADPKSPLEKDIVQVAAMLDIGDFLRVTGPDEESIQLHTDSDVATDPPLIEMVRDRAETPLSADLPGDETATVPLRQFNRSLARYRMLEAGRYRIQLVYEPEWNDDALNEARVGRVESNVLEIHVREPAPACVRGARTRALIQISRDGDEAVASLTNLYDLPVVVNLNIAGPVADAPMASLKWAVERHDRWAEKRPVKVPDAEANPTFHHDRLKSTPPGATIELQRMPIEALRAAAGGSDIAKVSVYYVNQASIGWQRKKAPGEIGAAGIVKPFDRAFPRGMLETAISATEMIPLGE